jgi:hypothetical protein
VTCQPLPKFDESNAESVRAAFVRQTPLQLTQAWHGTLESDFRAGVVRLGWRRNELLVLAELTDDDIFTRALQANERMWELGDTFELFLSRKGAESYIELHVTPANLHLHARFANAEAREAAKRTGDITPLLVDGETFVSRVWVDAPAKRWTVFARVPAAIVCGDSQPLAGQTWCCSFSRYDYSRDRAKPVLSSTSPHSKLDFHARADWIDVTFVIS